MPGVVRVGVPLVVVAEVVASVVRRIRDYQVDLAPLLVEGRHRLEVVALDEKVPRPVTVRAGSVLLNLAEHPRSHLA